MSAVDCYEEARVVKLMMGYLKAAASSPNKPYQQAAKRWIRRVNAMLAAERAKVRATKNDLRKTARGRIHRPD